MKWIMKKTPIIRTLSQKAVWLPAFNSLIKSLLRHTQSLIFLLIASSGPLYYQKCKRNELGFYYMMKDKATLGILHDWYRNEAIDYTHNL